MLRIAVTGGIACGKSLVGLALTEMDVPVCDTDALGHQQLAPGAPAFDNLVARFGSGVVDASSGAIDRAALGRLVFQDSVAREDLNAIVHPHVWYALASWFEAQADTDVAAAIALVPLLFETGAEAGAWDAIICVTAREEVVEDRLVNLRGLTQQEARQRVASQLPNIEKAAQADYVIVNNGSTACARQQTKMVMDQIFRKEKV